eukprot:1528306-Rhodomonas_salina.1
MLFRPMRSSEDKLVELGQVSMKMAWTPRWLSHASPLIFAPAIFVAQSVRRAAACPLLSLVWRPPARAPAWMSTRVREHTRDSHPGVRRRVLVELSSF